MSDAASSPLSEFVLSMLSAAVSEPVSAFDSSAASSWISSESTVSSIAGAVASVFSAGVVIPAASVFSSDFTSLEAGVLSMVSSFLFDSLFCLFPAFSVWSSVFPEASESFCWFSPGTASSSDFISVSLLSEVVSSGTDASLLSSPVSTSAAVSEGWSSELSSMLLTTTVILPFTTFFSESHPEI